MAVCLSVTGLVPGLAPVPIICPFHLFSSSPPSTLPLFLLLLQTFRKVLPIPLLSLIPSLCSISCVICGGGPVIFPSDQEAEQTGPKWPFPLSYGLSSPSGSDSRYASSSWGDSDIPDGSDNPQQTAQTTHSRRLRQPIADDSDNP